MTFVNKTILATTILTMMAVLTSTQAFADHHNTGDAWTQAAQEFFCHSNLSNLSITGTVSETPCEIIGDAADDWTSVSGSSWQLTESGSSAIDFKAANLEEDGPIGKMNWFALFGIMITANVELNTEVDFGDSTVDNGVYDIYTVIKHEMGHLPTLDHNEHSGDENISVMRSGAEIVQSAQRSISSNDAAAIATKYP